jgi:hypothetical protein
MPDPETEGVIMCDPKNGKHQFVNSFVPIGVNVPVTTNNTIENLYSGIEYKMGKHTRCECGQIFMSETAGAFLVETITRYTLK